MSNWKDDIVEQISISQYLLDSKVETAERLSMIIVDNTAEYILKAYVELEKRLVGKQIKKKDWEEKKRFFESLIDYVYSIATINADKQKILEYHDIRNNLYHQGLPLSVKPSKILSYVVECKTLLNDLVGFKMSENSWKMKEKEVRKEFEKKVINY